jgi:hypothetical protein
MRHLVSLVSLALLLAPASGAAQSHQLTQTDGVYTCERVTCSSEGEPCDYFGAPRMGECAYLVGSSPICGYPDQRVETYCCVDGMECPTGTACLRVEDQIFGVCVGDGTPLTLCTDTPTVADLEACRDLDFVGHDWSHGDCDQDGEYNQDDPDPCDGPGWCECWADIAGPPEEVGMYVVDVLDVSLVGSCFADLGTTRCRSADINCDGRVDYCDLAAIQLAFGTMRGSPDLDICRDLACGACDTDTGCIGSDRTACEDPMFLNGTYRGDGIGCDDLVPDAGPDVGPDVGPDAGPDVGSGSDTSPAGLKFRGAGGCVCRSTGGGDALGAGTLAWLGLACLALLTRGKRRRTRVRTPE